MPRESIIGSGFRGPGFEQKGFQERNLQLLLKTLSKKETAKSIEALSKIDKDEWKAMAVVSTQLNSFLALGGTSEIFATMAGSIKKTIKLQMDSFLSPVTNEINTIITDLLQPLIDLLTPMINDLTTFLSDNLVGAGIGGISGMTLSYFIPGGAFWVVLGAVLGALIEEGIEAFIAGPTPETLFGGPIVFWDFSEWLKTNPGGSLQDYLEYLSLDLGDPTPGPYYGR